MAMTGSSDDELRAEINVTPLVDVVLVLLVILLLVAPMLKDELPVELPIATEVSATGFHRYSAFTFQYLEQSKR